MKPLGLTPEKVELVREFVQRKLLRTDSGIDGILTKAVAAQLSASEVASIVIWQLRAPGAYLSKYMFANLISALDDLATRAQTLANQLREVEEKLK